MNGFDGVRAVAEEYPTTKSPSASMAALVIPALVISSKTPFALAVVGLINTVASEKAVEVGT